MKEIWVMKTFIVYNLDTRLPVAVGEAIKAEWARFETADKTRIRAENLIAEEISFFFLPTAISPFCGRKFSSHEFNGALN